MLKNERGVLTDSIAKDLAHLDWQGEQVYTPEGLGFDRLNQVQLHGGDIPQEAAVIFTSVMAGKATKAQTDVVVANAAFAIKTIEPDTDLGSCCAKARESIESGKAQKVFRQYVDMNS